MRFGFVGPTYPARSYVADGERCVNYFPERNESANAKAPWYLLRRPGLDVFAESGAQPVRALFSVSDRTFGLGDRCFCVSGNTFLEVFADGSVQVRGGTTFDTGPASISSNGRQLFIVTGQQGYIFDLESGNLDPAPIGPIVMGAAVGSYFVAMLPNSRTFAVSDLNEGLIWNPLDEETRQRSSDNIASILEDHGQLILFGSKTTEIWGLGTNPDLVFEPFQAGYIEQGDAAQWSPARIDNSVMWLGADSRGAGIVWRLNGYSPVRVSNFAVENAMQSYPRISDAEGVAFQERGHTFYMLRFPSAQKTWVYDASNGMWSEWSWWDQAHGLEYSHRGRCHTYCFGKHLVGDWQNGSIYEQSMDILSDFGGPIRRMRRSGPVPNVKQIDPYRRLTIDMDVGIGVPSGQGADPQVMIRYSHDSGKTWSNEKWRSAGAIGDYSRRVVLRGLGAVRAPHSLVIETTMTDPVNEALVDAFLGAEPDGPGDD